MGGPLVHAPIGDIITKLFPPIGGTKAMPTIAVKVPDDLGNIELQDTIRVAKQAEAAGIHSVWKGETSGTNTFMALSAIAQETETIKLATGIANVFSRSPALLAMSAATLDELSNGRAILGLGTSSDVLIEQWHGMEFTRPLSRVRETTEIVRAFYEDEVIEYDGEVFDIGPYSRSMSVISDSIPIYNAAMGPRNRAFTAAHADGWTPLFLPMSEMSQKIASIRDEARSADRDPSTLTVAPWIPFAISDDSERAELLARKFVSQEMAMGYNNLVRKYGFGDEGDEAAELWRDGDREAAAAALPEEMLDEFAIYGTPADCRDDIRQCLDAGVDLPVLIPPFHAEVAETEFMIESVGPLCDE